MYISDKIGNEWKEWKRNELVFLNAGTGSGKSTFALKIFAIQRIREGKSVLFLTPRTILVEQVKKEMNLALAEVPYEAPLLNPNFKVDTYQSLEQCIQKGIPVPEFDIYICDEVHYWITDSTFNSNTALSYYYVTRQTHACRIFMSATADRIFDFMVQDMRLYQETRVGGIVIVSGQNYQIYTSETAYDYLDVKYIARQDEVLELAQNTKGKTLIFVSNKEKGANICEELKSHGISCGFITADNKQNDAEKVVDFLVRNQTFAEKVLVTTSVLDVGVNICDEDVENVVIAAYDSVEFLQMLGRIRQVSKEQHLTLYIYQRSYTEFDNLLKRQIEPAIKCVNFLENVKDLDKTIARALTIDDFQVPDGYERFLYSDAYGKLHINRLKCYQYRKLHRLYHEIAHELRRDPDYFIKLQLSWLGLEDEFCVENFCSTEVKEQRKRELSERVKAELSNKAEMTLEELRDIMERLKPLVRLLDKDLVRSNDPLSWRKFNKLCKMCDLPFQIEKKGKDKSTRKEMYGLKVSEV